MIMGSHARERSRTQPGRTGGSARHVCAAADALSAPIVDNAFDAVSRALLAASNVATARCSGARTSTIQQRVEVSANADGV
jgi:hypothetical protein